MPAAAGVIDLLDEDAWRDAEAASRGAAADFRLDEIVCLRPVPWPEKTVCVGVNYARRNEEYDDTSMAGYPSVFLRAPDTLIGHGQPILRPPESEKLDYEAEIALVIGRGGRRIPRERALDHIAGLTCLNEGTIRDWTRHGKFNVTQGKNFDASGSVGPWLVTADEFAASGYDNIRLTGRVNGEVRQDDTTANLIFDFAYLIAYISTWTALKPGDVISTGTPVGAGARFDPPKWLTRGDVVEIEVSGVGTLRNTVADEA